MANVLYGESQDGDAAYGLVLMPSTFLIEDSLEFVARYQYAGADNDDLSLTSRYAKRAGGDIEGQRAVRTTLFMQVSTTTSAATIPKCKLELNMKLWSKKTVMTQTPPLSGLLTACISRTPPGIIN